MRKQLAVFLALGLSFLISFGVKAQDKIKVACVGNSITEGWGLKKPYPMVLQELLGDTYEVRNFGVSGRTLLKKGDSPYWKETKFENAKAWNPDVVIIKLGTNDSKPQNWKFKDEFIPNYIELVKTFQNLPSKPTVYVCYPIPVFEDKWGITESIVKNEIIPAAKKVAKKTKAKTIDLYKPFAGKAHLVYDGVHPSEEGAVFLANEVYQALSKTYKKK